MSTGLVQQLASDWNIAPVDASEASNISAALWNVNTESMESAHLPSFVIAMALSPIASRRRVDGRMDDTSLDRGTIGLLPPGDTGRWFFKKPYDVFHVYTGAAFVERIADNLGLSSVSLNEVGPFSGMRDPCVAALMRELLELCRADDAGAMHIECIAGALIASILRRRLRVPAAAVRRGLAPWQVKRVRELMSADLAQDLGLSRLASEARLSSFHFARAFRLATGSPPHQFLVGLRVERACELLETTDLPITEISAQVGYDSPGNLARVFRRELGCTPSAYRRERRS